MDFQLIGKTALITGGSDGIGFAVAENLAKEKANVIICSRTENKLVQKTKYLNEKYGINSLGITCDVSKANDINSLVEKLYNEVDSLDIIINNAGTGSNEKIMEADDDKWQFYWDLHVMSAVRLTRSLVPLMKKSNEGVIINNASICAKQPLDYEPIYNVTKSALMMFSKCLANELIQYNIRVNCINPGLVLTRDWENTAKELTKEREISWKGFLENIAKEKTPIGRFASPDEIAKFFVFLCSPVSSYCVGSTFYIDGGWLNVVA